MATLDQKLMNPSDVYASPAEVLVDDHLDHDEKVRVLAAWRLDAERLSDSTNEGMGGGENARLRDLQQRQARDAARQHREQTIERYTNVTKPREQVQQRQAAERQELQRIQQNQRTAVQNRAAIPQPPKPQPAPQKAAAQPPPHKAPPPAAKPGQPPPPPPPGQEQKPPR